MADLGKANTIAKQTVEEMASRLSEPVWLLDNRLAAWESYFKTPMPSEREEGWKRTSISSLDLSGMQTSNLPAAAHLEKNDKAPEWLSSILKHFAEAPSGLLYQTVKGQSFYSLNKELADKGVILCDMATAVEKHGDKIKSYFSASYEVEEDGKFGLLSKALFNCGLFLYIPRGVEISSPFFYAVDLDFESGNTSGTAVLPRTLVVAEDMSSAKLTYMIHSPTAAATATPRPTSLVSQFLEIHVKPAAKFSFLEVQQQSSDIFMVNRSNCFVDRDARYESLVLALGGSQTKSDMATVLQAAGASSEILGIVFGAGEEKFSFNTIQDHSAPDTKSDITFRVALREKSSSVYQGIVRVAKIAQRTDAYQSNKNLLLDGTATADSIPKLEILADDVKCSHGATVGPVDREQIFYLMSRGVSRTVAEQLVVLGFFRQTLEKSPFTAALSWLSEAISKKIHGGKLDAAATDFFVEIE